MLLCCGGVRWLLDKHEPLMSPQCGALAEVAPCMKVWACRCRKGLLQGVFWCVSKVRSGPDVCVRTCVLRSSSCVRVCACVCVSAAQALMCVSAHVCVCWVRRP